jgi:hypothetical protein
MLKQFSPNAGILNPGLDYLYGLIIQRTIRQAVISLGGAATRIPTTPLQYRKSLLIFNNSGDIIYIGGSDVTAINGYPIYPRGQMNIQIEDGVDLYAISAGAASDIRICEGA